MARGGQADQPIDGAMVLRILEVARQLAGPFELATLLTQLIDAGREVLGADRGSVFLYDPTTRELYSTVATGAKEIRFTIDKGIAGEAARTRQTICVADCYADPRFNPEVDRRTGYRTQCLIAVPLIGLDDELVGVLQLINPAKGRFDPFDEKIAQALASQAAVAIQRVRLIEERMVKMKLERDLALARQIQMNVLPDTLPVCPGYDLAGFSQPAEETGGDIYDVIVVPPSHPGASDPALLLLLADATGHGIGPALSVTQVRAMLRMGLRLAAGLDDLLVQINAQVADDLESSRFVTAFFGRLDPHLHRVDYHAAGQGPLLHFHAADSSCQWHGASTLPLGILPDIPLEISKPIELAPGDLLVLLTDGFYEYQDAAGRQMGKDRIGEVVQRLHSLSAREILDALRREVLAFAAGAPQLDDLTAIILKRQA